MYCHVSLPEGVTLILFEVTGLFQQTELCAVCMDGEKKVGGEDGAFKSVAIKLAAKFSFP